MVEGLNEAEFETLLFNLDLSPDRFVGNQVERTIELIRFYRRRCNGDLSSLVSELCETFPDMRQRLVELGQQATLTKFDMVTQPEGNSDLKCALETAKRVLATLEAQAAGYTSLTIPVSLKIELEDKRKEVAKLKSDLQSAADA